MLEVDAWSRLSFDPSIVAVLVNTSGCIVKRTFDRLRQEFLLLFEKLF